MLKTEDRSNVKSQIHFVTVSMVLLASVTALLLHSMWKKKKKKSILGRTKALVSHSCHMEEVHCRPKGQNMTYTGEPSHLEYNRPEAPSKITGNINTGDHHSQLRNPEVS